jgi:serine/threonine protein kinase
MSQNRYEVLGKIADGGLGSVYKAYDRNLRREVALKRVRADTPEEADRQAEQLFEEARTLSTLQHPHIVTIFDVGRDEEGAYIVMELLKGETLEDIISRGALNEFDFRELATQSLEGMIAAHSSGLIHLDIKPQNFMVIWLPSGKFQIKILDFGLAKLTSQPLVQEMDDDGAIMGSIYFMSPEQFERSPVDARTDLYALGCVFYYALTQHYPFQGETGPEVMASHMYHSLIPLDQLRPDLPPFVHQWIEWLFNRLPSHRPESASQAFESFQTGQFPTVVESISQPVPEYDGPILQAEVDTDAQHAQPAAPRIVRPGSTTGPLRPTPPRPTTRRPTRPVPGARPPGSATLGLTDKAAPRPLARPINIAAAAAPKHLKPTRKLPAWLTLGLPLTILAVAGGIYGLKALNESKLNSRLNELAQQEQPHGGPADLQMLLAMLQDPAKSQRAADVLAKLQGVESEDDAVASLVGRAKEPWLRKSLATIVAHREIKGTAHDLIDQMGSTEAADVRIALWNALAKVAAPNDLSSLITQLGKPGPEELRAAENALLNVGLRDSDLAHLGQPIVQAYRANSGSEDIQSMHLRLIGRLGAADGYGELTKALKHNSAKLRISAANALGEWRTAAPMEALESFIKVEKDPYIRVDAIASMGTLATLAGIAPQEEIADSLIAAYNNTKNAREQAALLAAISRVADPKALAFLDELSKSTPRLKPQTDAALKSLNAALAKITEVSGSTELQINSAELTPGPLLIQEGAVTNWFGRNDAVSWLVNVAEVGSYEITVQQASAATGAARYAVTFGSGAFSKSVESTAGPSSFKSVIAGTAQIKKPGRYRLWVRPLDIPKGEALMRLKGVTLKKV